jgi:hypothetical protein
MKKLLSLSISILLVIVLLVTTGQPIFEKMPVRADYLGYWVNNNCTHLNRGGNDPREWQTDDQGVSAGVMFLWWAGQPGQYFGGSFTFRRQLGPIWWEPSPDDYVHDDMLCYLWLGQPANINLWPSVQYPSGWDYTIITVGEYSQEYYVQDWHPGFSETVYIQNQAVYAVTETDFNDDSEVVEGGQGWYTISTWTTLPSDLAHYYEMG